MIESDESLTSIWIQALESLQSAYDPDIFESGQCANLAVALAMLAQMKGEQADPCVTVIFRDSYFEGEAEPYCTTFSHAYASLGNVAIDAYGSRADERWEARWDDAESDEEESRFRYVTCTIDALEALCAQFNVQFDPSAQNEYLAVLDPIASHGLAPAFRNRDACSERSTHS